METPSISDSRHTHSTYGLGNFAALGGVVGLAGQGGINNAFLAQSQHVASDTTYAQLRHAAAVARAVKPQQIAQQENPVMTRRLVQVLIADPDEMVPLEKCLLYTGSQKLTDLNDQELFFEIDIKGALDQHNAMRAQTADKSVKERVEYLEPAKIRDLKMVVVTIAQF